MPTDQQCGRPATSVLIMIKCDRMYSRKQLDQCIYYTQGRAQSKIRQSLRKCYVPHLCCQNNSRGTQPVWVRSFRFIYCLNCATAPFLIDRRCNTRCKDEYHKHLENPKCLAPSDMNCTISTAIQFV